MNASRFLASEFEAAIDIFGNDFLYRIDLGLYSLMLRIESLGFKLQRFVPFLNCGDACI
jgi:hypothetical protein